MVLSRIYIVKFELTECNRLAVKAKSICSFLVICLMIILPTSVHFIGIFGLPNTYNRTSIHRKFKLVHTPSFGFATYLLSQNKSKPMDKQTQNEYPFHAWVYTVLFKNKTSSFWIMFCLIQNVILQWKGKCHYSGTL